MARKYYVIHSEQTPAASDYDISTNLVEIVMKTACTASDLPTNVAPGSIAYKVGSTLTVYSFSADGVWEEIEL